MNFDQKANDLELNSLQGPIKNAIQHENLFSEGIELIEWKKLIYLFIKRIMDILTSLFFLFLSSPIIFFICIYIKYNSRGKILFKQIRIKKNRRDKKNRSFYFNTTKKIYNINRRDYIKKCKFKYERRINKSNRYYLCDKNKIMKKDKRKTNLQGQPFKFYKFRTMYSDANRRFPKLYDYKFNEEELTRLYFKKENDPRVPNWAKWLRRSSLDEIPNFINVLRGDMSIVGPRPDIPEMLKYYNDIHKYKLKVKPGITGLAQIEGRGNLRFYETLNYDLEYVMNQSLILDLKIIIKTIVATIKQNGAF
jgi:lipopolysaccharide/colanic/teichoic acid biosynthesis glycosyltransferase